MKGYGDRGLAYPTPRARNPSQRPPNCGTDDLNLYLPLFSISRVSDRLDFTIWLRRTFRAVVDTRYSDVVEISKMAKFLDYPNLAKMPQCGLLGFVCN